MQEQVPATRRIRLSRVHNIDTDRLMRRRSHLVGIADDGFRVCARRLEMVQIARELFAIENELQVRGVTIQRRSLTRQQCDAMSTPIA